MKPNRILIFIATVALASFLLASFAPAADVFTALAVSAVLALVLGTAVFGVGKARHLPTYALGLLVMGCEPACATGQLSPGTKKTLGEVVSRVDVARLLECGGAGDAKAVAKCLGARVLTEGLEEAMFRAQSLAEQAEEVGNEAAGAADMTDAQKSALAVDLELALDQLGHEISAANAL